MKRNIKLVIADVDRTLRMKGNPIIGEKTRTAFQRLHEQGVLLGVASGRPLWQNLETHYLEWDLGFQFDLIIGTNGGEIHDVRKNKKYEINYLQPDEIKKIILSMDHFDLNPFIYRDNYMLATRIDELMKLSMSRNHSEVHLIHDLSDYWEIPTGKILYRTQTGDDMIPVEAFAKTLENETVCCFKTDVNLLEFQDRRNSKGAALKWYCEQNNIPLDEVLALGDAENDMDMLEAAGWSVAVANAMPVVKAMVDDVTEFDAAHDGAGDFLLKYLLD